MDIITSVQLAIKKAHAWAAKNQYPEGYWSGVVSTNNTTDAEFIFLNYFFGINNPEQNKKCVKDILNGQQDDGSWGTYYQSPGDVSVTVECYFALKLSGLNEDLALMQKAREFILSQGGVDKAYIPTKIWLALFGQWPWEKTPFMLPEIILLPKWCPGNIYQFASWVRSCMLPLSILIANKPICTIPESAYIKELFPEKNTAIQEWFSFKNVFAIFDKGLRLYDKMPWKPGRKRAIKKIVSWLLERQDKNGTWGGIQVASFFSMLALNVVGYKVEDPVIQRCLNGFINQYTHETNNTLQIEATNSPIWDSALILTALQYSGAPIDSPMITKGIQFLLDHEVLTKGDWQVANPEAEPGGWAFEFDNSFYPDADDTAEVLIALSTYQQQLKTDKEDLKKAIQKGAAWMLSMQSKNGGWAAFDKDNTEIFLSKLPLFDIGEILDPPGVDVTGHVLEALSKLGYTKEFPPIQKAIQFIFKEQEADGSWFGRWGVNYLYGTSSVLIGLSSVQYDMTHPSVVRAIQWMLSKQNSDGGWGEACTSFYFLEDHGRGESTATQTAWALMGLMAGGLTHSPAVTKGIQYLCDTLPDNGIWNEPQFTASGIVKRPQTTREDVKKMGKNFPTDFGMVLMFRLDLYRYYWPLRALGIYLKSML